MNGTDTHGHTIGEYPNEFNEAKLLGINGEGFAEYLRDDEVILARLDETGQMRFPAPEFGLAHELSLSEFGFDLRSYLEAAAAETGEWRAVSEFARAHRTYR